jgi:DNA-binding beta-propeller fold protein YncE/transcriptional regulator with XRE-family HTH domain
MNRKHEQSFGALLQRHRRTAGLTQEELAERAELSVRQLSYLEQGKHVARPGTIRRLADALQLTSEQRDRFQSAASNDSEDGQVHKSRDEWTKEGEAVLAWPGKNRASVSATAERMSDAGIEHTWTQFRFRRLYGSWIGAALVVVLLLAGIGVYRSREVGSARPRPLNGVLVADWGQAVFNPGKLVQPEGIATDTQGNVYVADAKADRIFCFSPSGTLLNAWGTKGIGPGHLRYPTALVVADNKVYVADTGNDRVQKFTTSGKVLGTWGSTGGLRGQFRRPDGIAVDAQGYIYVSDWENNRIQLLGPDGHVVAVFETNGLPPVQTPPYGPIPPGPLAIDPSGAVYVVDEADAALNSFTHDSSWNMLATAYVGAGEITFPVAVATDSHQHVYVTDLLHMEVVELSPTGNLLRRWGSEGRGPGQFQHIGGVAVGKGGDVYVTDLAGGRVERFSPTGTFISQWGPQLGMRLRSPQALALDSSGNVYTADSTQERVLKLSPSGKLLASLREAGTTSGGFNDRVGLALDRQGNLYMADRNNFRIQKLSPAGKVLFVLGSAQGGLPPHSSGQLNVPSAVAMDSDGQMYVADGVNDQVLIFNEKGEFLAAWTHLGFGSDPSTSNLSAVALDRGHNIYVADARQGKISVLSPTGILVRQWRAPGVQALAIDRAGRVYAASVRHVVVFSATGALLGRIANRGSSPFTFGDAAAVAVGANDTVYVGDVGRGRLYKFAPPQ